MAWNDIICAALLTIGVAISLIGSLGLLRFPDFYTRLHTAGKTDSLAQLCIFVGLAFIDHVTVDGVVYPVDPLIRLKLLMVAVLLFFTAPTATHAITKAALLDGVAPWKKGDPRQ
ncbi:MAG: monovalent cation/H(+) antiporter subunit G [Nannocystaceae bacterium]